MIKLVAIFSFYFLALTILPCGDNAYAHENNHGENSSTNLTISNSHDHSDDYCTSFCSCTCCGQALSVVQLKNYVFELVPNYKIYNIIYKDSPTQKYISSLWQPPKV